MNPQSCYICTMTSVFYSRNLFKTKSKYSETRIYDFICKFLGKMPSTRLSSIRNSGNDDCVCIECLGKIDEYDLATITAQRVETEIRDFLMHAESLISPESKVGLIGSSISAVASNDDDHSFVRPIESIEMVDQFKIENNESNDSSDLAELKPNDDDYDANSANDSDDEYHPPAKSKKQSHSKRAKTTQIALTKGQRSNLKCTECNVTFKSVTALRRHKHLRSDNGDNTPNQVSCVINTYKCPTCSEILRTKVQFDTHLKQHKEDEEQFKCAICGFDLKEKTALDEHTKLHADLSALQCVLCKKTFKQKGALVRHMRIHSGLHFYQCHRCGKGFVHKSSFEMHLMAHDDIRKKQCPHCTQMFRSSSHLNRHLRIHTGSKPYSCPVCSQKFAQRYNMNVHLRLHDTSANRQKSDKTHICKFCNSSFARLSKLEEHLKKNHEAVIPHTSIGNNLNDTISEK